MTSFIMKSNNIGNHTLFLLRLVMKYDDEHNIPEWIY